MKSTTNLPGADSELSYWQHFVKTDRFIDGWCSPWKNPDLEFQVADFIRKHVTIGDLVLDCGSGPVSILNGLLPKSQIATVDPLSKDYREIFDYDLYDIRPPINQGIEQMTFKELFFIVHMRNALDHCQDPAAGFERMLQAVKPGGYIILQGFINDGKHVNYDGLHQWDIELNEMNQLVVKDKDGIIALVREEPVYCEKIQIETSRDWFIWIEQKIVNSVNE